MPLQRRNNNNNKIIYISFFLFLYIPNDCSIEDLEDLSGKEQPILIRSHVTGDADSANKSIHSTNSQGILAVTRSPQQLFLWKPVGNQERGYKTLGLQVVEARRSSPLD